MRKFKERTFAVSTDAPWLALSVDWQDSAMLDDATHGERLAWVCLLCHAKSQGRGGRVRLRKNAFQTAYRLSERAVMGMLERAQKCAAIEVNGDFISLCNWGSYQGKADSKKYRESCRIPETTDSSATKHQAPRTKDKERVFPASLDSPAFHEVWRKWEQHRREIKKPLTPTAGEQCLSKCEDIGLDRAMAALKHTMAMGWQGMREPEDGEQPRKKKSADEAGAVLEAAWRADA